jgi:hypothetical protein
LRKHFHETIGRIAGHGLDNKRRNTP